MAEFLVTVSGRKLVYLGDDHEDVLERRIEDEYPDLQNIVVEDGAEVEVDFTATFRVSLEGSDLEEYIREEYGDVMGDTNIDSIDEV